MVEILEFVAILSLSLLLTVIIMLHDYYLTNTKEGYSKKSLAMIIVSIRMLSGPWIIFITKPTRMAVIQAVAMQLTILLFLRALSKYVQNRKRIGLLP
ncbi:hypothetical protein [Bacillus clarus]|uniref:Putative membrane protein n=1 Tax=Bacillus clarus TaxID=2338372 RepID=A0A090YMJ2_9BACI|nr:hypothetical protein [Bacillus clarus]KFM99122.1 putative membrane protein [Bacillus clarus]